MDIGTKDLLISFLIILLALCLLQILYMATYAYRTKELQNWKIALFPIITLILSMLFPLITNEDNIWDLRFIPFIIAGLYGGYKLGLVQISTALIHPLLIGRIWLLYGSCRHYYCRNSRLHPFKILFKNEVEATTFTVSDFINLCDFHFSSIGSYFFLRSFKRLISL